MDLTSVAAKHLYKIYKLQNKPTLTLEMLELYKLSADSLLKQKNETETQQKLFAYDTENKKIADRKQNEINALKQQQKLFLFYGAGFLIILAFGIYFKLKQKQSKLDRYELINQIEGLKKKALLHKDKEANQGLNRSKVESAIDAKLNDTDWKILESLFTNPVITNKELAAEVFLSLDGTNSSLGKMYKLFELKRSNNNKLNLVVKATSISNQS